MKHFQLLLIFCLPLLLLTGCAASGSSREFFAMDTVMQATAYGSNANGALQAAEEEIYRLEQLFSCQAPEAELARCNRAGEMTVSAETSALVQTTLDLSEATGGAYDPTLYPLSLAWGFSGGAYRVPDAEELRSLLAVTGASRVSVNGCRVTLQPGTQLDLGGIAKGYAAGQLRKLFTEAGVRSAIVSLGGNIAAIGTKPDGSDWQVGLQDPENPDTYFGILSVRDASPPAATSAILSRTACAIIIFSTPRPAALRKAGSCPSASSRRTIRWPTLFPRPCSSWALTRVRRSGVPVRFPLKPSGCCRTAAFI